MESTCHMNDSYFCFDSVYPLCISWKKIYSVVYPEESLATRPVLKETGLSPKTAKRMLIMKVHLNVLTTLFVPKVIYFSYMKVGMIKGDVSK